MDCNGDGQEALVVDVSAGAIDPAKEKLVKEEPVEVIPSDEVEPEGGANFELVGSLPLEQTIYVPLLPMRNIPIECETYTPR